MPTHATLNEELPDRPITPAARVLRAGTRLNDFELGEPIDEGSAAIVYAATDRAHGVPVAVAEYMPARLAQRNDDAQVRPRTPAQADAFAKGLKAFVNEARTLARCNHPSLIRITRVWEANATACCAMPLCPARRLLDVRRGMKEPPDEAALRALLDALLGALDAFHRAGGWHGKVTPSNILLQDDNKWLLLGPGAADRAIVGDQIDALMTRSEPCFAPIEQLVEGDVPLNPAVDLYSLAGVARFWLSGQLPPPAFGAPGTARRETIADAARRLQLTWPRLRYSASLLNALDSALSIYPAERPQSVAQMRARLDPAPASTGRPSSPAPTASTVRNDALPPPRAPAVQPASKRVVRELDPAMVSSPDLGRRATSGVARIDGDPPVRTASARHGRFAMWSGTLLTLLALLLVGVGELRQEHRFGRVLEFLGFSAGMGAGDGAVAPPSAMSRSAPSATPSIAGEAEAAKPIPAGPAVVDTTAGSDAAVSTSPSVVPNTAADEEAAKPMSTGPNAADSPPGATAAGATAPDSSPSPPAASATAAPVAVAQSPATIPARAAKQHVSRSAASPREACGERTQFSMYRCMQMQCSQPRWAANAQCEHLRKTDSVD